jgi:biopolymer transport protein ExbD
VKFPRRPARPHKALELTALLDVIFILLIFFMLNAQIEHRQGLSLQLPAASQTQALLEQHIEISLNSLNQISVENRQFGLGELKAWLEEKDRNTPILIQGDQDASYGKALAIFDLLQSLGYRQVALGTVPPRL